MSNHTDEYNELLTRVLTRDRDAIVAHWELGQLFVKYGESVTDIAQAIGRSVTYVSDHMRVGREVINREHLETMLEERDDVETWTILVDWVKAGGPGQEDDSEPDAKEISRQRRGLRGNQLFVPPVIIKSLADLGLDAREVMTDFWANASAKLILNVAYPGQIPERVRDSIDEAERRMASDAPMTTLDQVIGV